MQSDNNIKSLIEIFTDIYHQDPEVIPLPGGGSSRSYFRLVSKDRSVVGAYSKDIKENQCFIRLSQALESEGIRVPHIIKTNSQGNAYIMEDLGDMSLLSCLAGEDKINLASKALRELVRLQTLQENIWLPLLRYSAFSERLVKWDLNYFKYDFLKALGIDFDEERLEDDFDSLSQRLLNMPEEMTGLMYRDFQSRNIMVKDKELCFIDFQGARKGPMVYDLVSFLWQAKASFTWEQREELIELYAMMLYKKIGVSSDLIKKEVLPMALFRCLQVLGAYGLRGIIERKQHFVESIPAAVKNLQELSNNGYLDAYPELKSIVEKLSQRFIENESQKVEGLTITIGSFSFKKGYPEDKSGNGGGFVFDCRGLPNPGRYDEYKSLTGHDLPVKEFLQKYNNVGEFISMAYKITSGSIDNYLERGFNSLHIWFGCTGGRHRSVYCAENLGNLIKSKYGEKLRVRLIHREHNIDQIIEKEGN